MNQFATKTAPGPRPQYQQQLRAEKLFKYFQRNLYDPFYFDFPAGHAASTHNTTAPLHKFAFIFRHHKALKWNWIYNFSNICGLELAPLHSIPVLIHRILLRLLYVCIYIATVCVYSAHLAHGTWHVLMTTPVLCSAQKYVISLFLFPPAAAGGLVWCSGVY